jgi:hypothetical protein
MFLRKLFTKGENMFYKLLTAALIASTPYLAADNHCDCPSKNHILYRTDAYVQGNFLVNKFTDLFSQLISTDDTLVQNLIIDELESSVLGTTYTFEYASYSIPDTIVTNRAGFLSLAAAIYNQSNPTLIVANNTYPTDYNFNGCARDLNFFSTLVFETPDFSYPQDLDITWGRGFYHVKEYTCDVLRIDNAAMFGGVPFIPCCVNPG